MTSRLDRLFILLESGSSAVTRRAAAKQIGEVQKLYPHDLHALLNRLISYLHSSSWDTRIAAAQSVEAILANVPAWKPETYALKSENIKKADEVEICAGDDESCQSAASSSIVQQQCSGKNQKEKYLTFAEFDLEQVLHKGARLIGSEGIEFELQESEMTKAQNVDGSNGSGGDNISERISLQRALLNEKLGLTQASKLGVNLTDMITDEDMLLHQTNESDNINEDKVPVEDILKLKGKTQQQLSCREMNRAKRKARQNQAVSSNAVTTTTSSSVSGRSSKNVSRRNSTSSVGSNSGHSNNIAINTTNEPERKKAKLISTQNQEIFYSLNAPVPDATGMWVDAVKWPLENFCSRLYLDLFNPKWEIRHGAATALRELINHHSSGAGKSLDMTKEEMLEYHNLWLEDAALRLLCVLCLDRFGDFVSDQVVAPVRETVSQVLGTIVKEMPVEKVDQTVKMLIKLLKQKEWEVRHGGLLGLKYVFVVRNDLLQIYLPNTINDILIGLLDTVDDVGAVAAATLIPVAALLPKLLNPLQVSSIVKMLWDLLLDQDELTSACNSFMGLLAAILSLPKASHWIQMEPMSNLVPRLWPFLSHSTSSVRRSTLLTLQTLTDITDKTEIKIEDVKPKVETMIATATTPTTASLNLVNMNFDSNILKLNLGVIDWPVPLLQSALRHLYQRILVEPNADIQLLAKTVWLNIVRNADLGALLHAACPYVSTWICLSMQPPRLAFDPNMLISVENTVVPLASSSVVAEMNQKRRTQRITDDLGAVVGGANMTQKLYLGGSEATPLEIRERNHMRARVTAARVLGVLSPYLVQLAPGIVYTPEMESPTECYTKVLLGHLNSRSAVQRIVCALIIAFWAQMDATIQPGPAKLQERLKDCILEYVYYDEVANLFTRLLQESHDLIATLKQYKVPIEDFNQAKILTLAQIENLATTLTPNALATATHLKPKIQETFEERRKSLLANFQQTSAEQMALDIRCRSALAGAIVCLHCLPEKLNPIVKPLMESIKREDCELLQELSAEFLVHLMEQICDRTPSPNSKILTNLCTLLRSDMEFTPKINFSENTLKHTTYSKTADNDCVYYGILTLSLQQHTSYGQRGSGGCGGGSIAPTRGPGRPPLHENLAAEQANAVSEETKLCRIQRMGSTSAIIKLCSIFDSNLIERIPVFEQLMFGNIADFVAAHESMDSMLDVLPDIAETNDLMTSLQLFEIAAPHLNASLHPRLFEMLPKFGVVVTHPLKAIRHMASRCIAVLASIDPCSTLDFAVNYLVKLLSKIEQTIQRQGAIEAIERVVEKLQIRIVPYIVLLVVPLLGCMSDPDESVRLLSTHCFATLIQLMPLDSKIQQNNSKNEIKSAALLARKTRDREFLDYLFTPKSIPNYKVPVTITVELRTYQQAGVNWLWFLNKYNLHGILCDDMGLGKTLQAICILAGDHFQRQLDKATPLPSLVICPPTLTGHWVYEVEKFLQKSATLRPLHYVGLPQSREKLRCLIGGQHCNLIVSSYDTIRKDIDFFSSIHWNYCILDEGHIIKNGKTKSSRAIKMLKAQHRLILSGTPIQNNVLELWSLFDFLMPGFLGTEKQFIARYSRPILASRDSKSSSKEQEAGVLAMESLHRQVLPFLLRRVKEDVLTDLPPKITQDLLCELSPLQERLYEDFSRTHLNSDIKDCLENLGAAGAEGINTKTHIFHALRYLQNVCNHPKLVLNSKHPEYTRIAEELAQQQSSLNDIEHSAKLPALKQLLLDCGIGVQTETVSQHRALIFCQLKAMLDIVEKDLLRKHLPTVTYLRLDGSVPASLRQDIVNNFNSDPSIDVLLLTTQVGGLGLNLTGADTVIFVEHDWNPMKDLQAMDRAHRIGQKKVVNVYRLITRKSLEEKIMGLQKFKILTANTVVSSENASMETMATEQLFDLFTLQEQHKNNSGGNAGGNSNGSAKTSNTTGGASMNAIFESLPDLWSESQYDEEYDLANFMQTLKK